tara:strand:+ start:5747 stop:6547 length:801 start_codon:yes stop_codon:yes gene_type:complete
MPIVKPESKDMLKAGRTYDIIPRDIHSLGLSCEALSIWLYLQSKPRDWIPREKDILTHFSGLGRKRYQRAVKELKETGMWQVEQRRESGKIVENVVTITHKYRQGRNLPVGESACRETDPHRDTKIVTDTEKATETEKPHNTLLDEECEYYFYRLQKACKRYPNYRPAKGISPDAQSALTTLSIGDYGEPEVVYAYLALLASIRETEGSFGPEYALWGGSEKLFEKMDYLLAAEYVPENLETEEDFQALVEIVEMETGRMWTSMAS